MAGVGNVYRSEVLFIEQTNPFAPVGSLDDPTLGRLIETARRLLAANVRGAHPGRRTTTGGARDEGQRPGSTAAGQSCRRCGTPIRASLGRDLPRTVWWCPRCQAHAPRAGLVDAERGEVLGWFGMEPAIVQIPPDREGDADHARRAPHQLV